jgi:predicted amidohydrolase YtcJ
MSPAKGHPGFSTGVSVTHSICNGVDQTFVFVTRLKDHDNHYGNTAQAGIRLTAEHAGRRDCLPSRTFTTSENDDAYRSLQQQWREQGMSRIAFFLCLATVSLTRCGECQPPDLIIHNAHIVTVDDQFSIAEAMAIREDRVMSLGSTADLLPLAGPDTTVVDAAGRTILPGLIDSHVHPGGASMYEFDHELPEMDSIADVLQYIRNRAAVLQPGQWIVVQQVFITRLKEGRYPTREELDAAAPANPVYFRTGPDASVNSLALRAAGIDRDFEVPADSGAKVERDPQTGEPTGILRSGARLIDVGDTGSKKANEEDRISRLAALLAAYNKVGITSIVDRNASDEAVALYQQLKARGELTCRTFLCHSLNPNGTEESLRQKLDAIANHPLNNYDDMLWLKGVKVFLDGGMLTGSAWMLQPWGISETYSITDPSYRGLRYIEADQLYLLARMTLERDLQFTAHSVGDAAVTALIDAYERVDREDFPVRDKRPNITHCNFMTDDAIRRMQQLGIVADLQPAWLYLDGAVLTQQFGDERTRLFQPYRTLFEHGVIVGGGSDHMQKIGSLRSVNPYNPFLGMWITLVRQPRRMSGPLHQEQALNRAQAIRLYTSNNAWLTYEEQQKGSLEPGKLADFIMIDRDILACPVDDIRATQVVATWLGGRRVYQSDQ